ncbi:MAG TPA: Crp/Fnr family transcriptional regulator, partial [Ramlibacter sp.]|nr:Crp/Fnr family transcriptional regulator [Ramlibacter sp.]
MNLSRTGVEQDRMIAQLEPGIGRLAARGILRNYRKNTIILNEGEVGDSLFVMLQGQVKVY